MHPDLDDVLESVLAEYSRVEPAPAAVRRWQAVPEPAAAPAIRRMWPVWTAALAALLLALALLWMGGSMRGATSPRRTPAIPQPALAQEKMVLVPPNPNHSTPLTEEQKALIELLAKDPSALSHLSPDELDKRLHPSPAPSKEIKHP